MSDISTTSWSEVDNSNSQTPPEGWPSATMLPNQVEPTARAGMGAQKRWYNRLNPVYGATQSTADAYVWTPTQAITGYNLYEVLRLRMGIANGSTSPTLTGSSLPPQNIAKMVASSVTALAAGDIRAKDHEFYWDGTRYILVDPYQETGTFTGTGATVRQNSPTLVTPTLGAAAVTSLNGMTLPDTAGVLGYRNVPQNTQSGDYTTVAGDSGKHVYHPAGDTTSRTWTIPSNVDYPIGTAITFVNRTAAPIALTVATAHSITLGGTVSTGTRSLSQNAVGTAMKDTSTNWIITGSGVT